ncbi:MAG: NAD(P)/FAD-dependent oxidoreductase [Steroidobacteraceae bacterium]
MTASERRQVVVIGAGPAGAIASALLRRRERDVLVLERQRFPRFSIGESLLVHCLDFVAEAGMLEAVDAAGFQYKNGAAFSWGDRYDDFDFGEGVTEGRASTYEVQRATFDKLLADEAAHQGVEIRYETEIVAVECGAAGAKVTARSADGSQRAIECDFVLDASGFGRTLPRLLGLERPTDFPTRQAIFTHVADHISADSFDRNKILVTVHPQHRDVWYWLIPFSGGRASLGVVAREELLKRYAGTADERLRLIVSEDRRLAGLLSQAEWDTPAREVRGYAASVSAMHGPGFALLGNAAEFLDPVFSSGVTIAMRSASMAVHSLDRQLGGAAVDWDRDFERPLRVGIGCFKEFVTAWYDGRLQDIFFSGNRAPEIRRMICSILAGYAWDERNAFVTRPRHTLDVLAQLCAPSGRGPRA